MDADQAGTLKGRGIIPRPAALAHIPSDPLADNHTGRRSKSGGSLTNVHPHRFRRTLATDLIDSGMPIQDVAAILGHEKLDTTMKYVYLSNENIRSAYQRYMK